MLPSGIDKIFGQAVIFSPTVYLPAISIMFSELAAAVLIATLQRKRRGIRSKHRLQ
jgi:hypothetical protein